MGFKAQPRLTLGSLSLNRRKAAFNSQRATSTPHQIHPIQIYIHQNKKLRSLGACLEAEPIFSLPAGKTNKVAVITLSPAITSGYSEPATSHASNARTAITDNSQD
jgi:hypothetical protein